MDIAVNGMNIRVNGSGYMNRSTNESARYVEKYKTSSCISTQSVLELAKTVYDAYRSLPNHSLDEFCRSIHIARKSPKFSKLVRIGSRYDAFKSVSERLPKAEATLYKLASLKDWQWEMVLASDILHPKLSARRISDFIDTLSVRLPNAVTTSVTIDLSRLSEIERQRVSTNIAAMCESFGLNKTFS